MDTRCGDRFTASRSPRGSPVDARSSLPCHSRPLFAHSNLRFSGARRVESGRPDLLTSSPATDSVVGLRRGEPRCCELCCEFLDFQRLTRRCVGWSTTRRTVSASACWYDLSIVCSSRQPPAAATSLTGYPFRSVTHFLRIGVPQPTGLWLYPRLLVRPPQS